MCRKMAATKRAASIVRWNSMLCMEAIQGPVASQDSLHENNDRKWLEITPRVDEVNASRITGLFKAYPLDGFGSPDV